MYTTEDDTTWFEDLAVTPQEVHHVQSEIPRIANEYGWCANDPWVYELTQNLLDVNARAARAGYYQLLAATIERFTLEYYYKRSGRSGYTVTARYDVTTSPSPVEVVRRISRLNEFVRGGELSLVVIRRDLTELCDKNRIPRVRFAGCGLGSSTSIDNAVQLVSELCGLQLDPYHMAPGRDMREYHVSLT